MLVFFFNKRGYQFHLNGEEIWISEELKVKLKKSSSTQDLTKILEKCRITIWNSDDYIAGSNLNQGW